MPPDRDAAWIGGESCGVAELLDAPEPDLVAVPVGPEVGDVRNQGAGLVEPRQA